ncbi:hypothetical protein Taro_028538 [Colocasia esculenta]|uniref:Uncharacterized protein n=1 Tax=Colocasia esculenta TaxID=4460 RepID=A0A843VHI1_COLES|nr:hypothetical protein [Colocasia esculenta]
MSPSGIGAGRLCFLYVYTPARGELRQGLVVSGFLSPVWPLRRGELGQGQRRKATPATLLGTASVAARQGGGQGGLRRRALLAAAAAVAAEAGSGGAWGSPGGGPCCGPSGGNPLADAAWTGEAAAADSGGSAGGLRRRRLKAKVEAEGPPAETPQTKGNPTPAGEALLRDSGQRGRGRGWQSLQRPPGPPGEEQRDSQGVSGEGCLKNREPE